ncbi:NUDIX domain-containing protein, partial [Candidatus Woesearchaeota archaeon]|nr:NUDIX domain-containing protein [Candidatus Woesearchaeota archaeon]
MENKTFVAMKAVILNDKNEILIIQESSKDPSRSHVGKWDVPGGRLNFGEDPFEGLRREVKEETNL